MKFKNLFINSAIFLLFLLGIKNLIFSLPLKVIHSFEYFYSNAIHPNGVVVHHVSWFVLGLLMLLLVYSLYRRLHFAWLIEISALAVAIVIQLLANHRFMIPILLVEFYVLLVLVVNRKEFSRKSNPLTIKKAFVYISISAIIVIINSTVGLYLMQGHFYNLIDVGDAFIRSIQLLIFMDPTALGATSPAAYLYADILIALNWVCIIMAVVFLMKPLIFNRMITKSDRAKVRRLALLYGENPVSYLSLETDKQYFFSQSVEGVCAYTIVNDVFIVSGDPLCQESDGSLFLDELFAYCRKSHYSQLFINVTDRFLLTYEDHGCTIVKYGEDACFKLSDYNLKGGKVAKVRAAINHATKAGITVKEYRPLSVKDPQIEQQIEEITAEWLKEKGGYEMHFTVGGTGLQDPLDRRYFYASSSDGLILGFVVFLPYTDGYLADVTRRRTNAPQGVLEKIIYEAFITFRDEGRIWGNMGLSPLYNIGNTDPNTLADDLFTFIYENLNKGYGFKQLHHAKEKYAPTNWIPRYLVFFPNRFTPDLAYALVKCQFKEGFIKMLTGEFIPQLKINGRANN